ncbi:YdhR family protein [Desulfococcaceae bacterium HSG7]|nr:YdhR family protein [Desulfococcaceae bacterium HSG7]
MKNISKVFLYAEYQLSVPFDQLDWKPINVDMKKNPGLKSKTWLSGFNTNSIGGFYEFDSVDNAQKYIENVLIPFSKESQGSLAVRLFDGEITKEASIGMGSPFYAIDS